MQQTYIASGAMQETRVPISGKIAGPGLMRQIAPAGEEGRCSSSP
jgi:hypothetical protein